MKPPTSPRRRRQQDQQTGSPATPEQARTTPPPDQHELAARVQHLGPEANALLLSHGIFPEEGEGIEALYTLIYSFVDRQPPDTSDPLQLRAYVEQAIEAAYALGIAVGVRVHPTVFGGIR